jgi:hypothetical protein
MKFVFSATASLMLLSLSTATAAPVTTNLEVWLDADSLVGSTGTPVSTWTDSHTTEGGTGADDAVAYPAGGATRPTLQVASPAFNGHNSVRFTAGTALRNNTIASLSDITMFMVYRFNSLVNETYLLSFGSFDPEFGIGSQPTPTHFTMYDTAFRQFTSIGQSANSLYVLNFARTIDGTAAVDPHTISLLGGPSQTLNFNATATAGTYQLGSQEFATINGSPAGTNFDLAELLIYNGSLSTGDTQQVLGYLQDKYFPVPEPSSLTLCLAAVTLFGFSVRQRSRTQ